MELFKKTFGVKTIIAPKEDANLPKPEAVEANVPIINIDFKIDEVEHPDELVDEYPLVKIEDA